MDTTEDMIIHWEYVGNGQCTYFLNDQPMGFENAAIDQILQIIRNNPSAKVMIKLSHLRGLGGKDIIESMPLSDRYEELVAATDSKHIDIQFE